MKKPPHVETPTKEYTVKQDGFNIKVRVYGEPSKQGIEDFNRIFNDFIDEKEKRQYTASA